MATNRLIDLSHRVENGMVTYRGLPAPAVSNFRSREESAGHYAPGTTFHIGRIDMVANTGTYIDAPSHRFEGAADIAGLGLDSVADLPGLKITIPTDVTAIDRNFFRDLDVAGRAVIVHTGWSRHWRTDRYFTGHPYLTREAADCLASKGARLVGIDSLNVDDDKDGERPVHTRLLKEGIPIVEHLCGLGQLPVSGFRFFAVPVKVCGLGSFPVRAFAIL